VAVFYGGQLLPGMGKIDILAALGYGMRC